MNVNIPEDNYRCQAGRSAGNIATSRFPSRMSPAPRPRGSLTTETLREIRRRIVEGELQLGEALSEAALAALLGVSKTPVREALVQLKREGLVAIYPQRGTFVFQVDEDMVRDLCDFRRVLEGAALQRAGSQAWGQLVDALERCVKQMNDALAHREAAAYRHLDAEFHGSLFRLCGNALLAEAHEAIEFRVQSLRTRLSVAPEANEATLAEHTSIVGALVKRDLGRAHDLLMAHICKTEANYLCLLPR
jgi:DNA-binding GntR family transcriptional regulator